MGLLSKAKQQVNRDELLELIKESSSRYPANLFFISLRSLLDKTLEQTQFEDVYLKEQARERLFDNIITIFSKIFSKPNACVISDQQEIKAAIFSPSEIDANLLKQHLASILSTVEDCSSDISVSAAGVSKTVEGIMAFLLPEQ
ncbi:MAG: hypothetical protein K6F69_03390 [Treponema sp.]|nr:hypothetical protein [Treponema sp.]